MISFLLYINYNISHYQCLKGKNFTSKKKKKIVLENGKLLEKDMTTIKPNLSLHSVTDTTIFTALKTYRLVYH